MYTSRVESLISFKMKSPLLQGLLSRYGADGAEEGKGSTSPRYRPATPRRDDARDVPSGSAADPGRSTHSRGGNPFNDGQPIKATPPRHSGGRLLSIDMKRKQGGLSSIHANSPSNRTAVINSSDQTPRAGTNRLRVSATSSRTTKKRTSSPPPPSSNVSPLLRQAHSLRKISLTPPKMVQHVPRMSFGAVPESLDLYSAASLETLDTLSTMGLTLAGSASTDGAGFCDDGHNDDFTMVASVMSTSAIASSLNSGKSDDDITSRSKKEKPGLHYKKPGDSRSRSGGAIVNMEEVESTQAERNKIQGGVVDATSLLASLNIDTSRASQAEIALLTKAIGKLANQNDEDSGSIHTEGICDTQSVTSFLSHTSMFSRRQELERLKLLKLNSSVAKKEIQQRGNRENKRKGTATRNAINRATSKAAVAKKSSLTDPVEAFRALSPSSGKEFSARKSLSRSGLKLISSRSREAIKPAEIDSNEASRGRSISRSRSILLRSSPRSRAVDASKIAKPSTQTFRGRSLSQTRSNVARLPIGTTKQPCTTKTAKPPTQTFRGRSLSRTRPSVGRSPSPTISKVITATRPVSPKFRGRSVSKTRQKLGSGSTTIVASASPPRGQLNHWPPVPNAATHNRAERRKKRLSPPRP